MMKKLFALLLLCSPVLAIAQKKDKTAEKMAKTITAEDMKKHLYIIASKEMEGRKHLRRAWTRQRLILKVNLRQWVYYPATKTATGSNTLYSGIL